MQRLISILIFLGISFGCHQKQKMNFETYIRQIFFNADITNNNSSLLNHYKKLDNLKEVKYEGFTTYPPLSALGQEESPTNHIFKFKTHQNFPFEFEEGELILQTKKSQESLPLIKINFETKEQAEEAFQILIKNFRVLSAEKKTEAESWAKTAEFTNKNSKLVSYVMMGNSNDNTLLIMLEKKSDSPKE